MKFLQAAVVPEEKKKIDPSRLKGPVMKPKSNLAAIRRKLKDVEKACEPGPTTYNQDDRLLHEKLRD